MALDKGLYNATEFVLTNFPNTRNDDNALISKVIEITNPTIKGLKFNFVLENSKALGLPSLKSIDRYRRKLQNLHPELRAVREVEEARAGLEEEYKAFARV